MRLRFREKQSLYRSLGQLLRSGVTFPAALRSLAPSARGRLRRLLADLNQSVSEGHSIAEAFARQRPAITEMEASVVAAVERAGRLDHGLAQLAVYFGALEAARKTVIKRLAYPVFMLHFGILALAVTTLVSKGLIPFCGEVGTTLALVWGCVLIIGLLAILLRDVAATSATADTLLRGVPLIGSIRRNFAVSRFCATYEMQLGAGVNVMDALRSAARAARSGAISETIERALPHVVGGSQVGPLLAAGHAFPEDMLRDFSVGEQTGKLDEELSRLAAEHQGTAISKLETLADWTPKLLYAGICVYIGYRIVVSYQDSFRQIQELTG